MVDEDRLQQLLEERRRLEASRGFTIDYQHEQESRENVICYKDLAPTTYEKHNRAVENWTLWRLSRNESKEMNFSKEEPDPSPQTLKLFAESYIATQKNLPSQKSTCHNLTSFTSCWERKTSRKLPLDVKKDALKCIQTELTRKYELPTKPRERSFVTAKDIDYLLRHLFKNDDHDYKHERVRVHTGSALSLFAGSGARAGAVVESSSYPGTNECLYSKVAGNVFPDNFRKYGWQNVPRRGSLFNPKQTMGDSKSFSAKRRIDNHF